jgi:glycosyltransferase involved in cell wall biosynthesis
MTGLLVPPRQPEQLAAALLRFLDGKRLSVTMGMAARARVEKEFSWPRAAERVAAVYRRLIDEQRQRDMRLPRRLLPQRSEAIYGAD